MPSVSASSTSSGNGAASGVVSDLTREQADLRTIAVHDDHLVLRGNIRNLLRSTPYISALCIRADPFSALQKRVAAECNDDSHVSIAFYSLKMGSRTIGQLKQCAPPRPRPNSPPGISMTSTPARRIFRFVWLLRSYAMTMRLSSVSTLLPSFHCSDSVSYRLPPVLRMRSEGMASALAMTFRKDSSGR